MECIFYHLVLVVGGWLVKKLKIIENYKFVPGILGWWRKQSTLGLVITGTARRAALNEIPLYSIPHQLKITPGLLYYRTFKFYIN